MTGDVERYLAVGAVLFVLGALGFFTRRNLIVMVLSAEMMLHGVSLTLITLSRAHHNLEGQAFTIFILTVAACEAGLALSLILALYRRSNSLDVELWAELREADLPPPMIAQEPELPPFIRPLSKEFPRLTPAGIVPTIRDHRDRDIVDDAASPTGETPAGPPSSPEEVVKSVTD
jgi:NADH-quinone oxidoreductase subunit K